MFSAAASDYLNSHIGRDTGFSSTSLSAGTPDLLRLSCSGSDARDVSNMTGATGTIDAPSSSSSSRYLAFLRCPSVQLLAIPRLMQR